MKQLLFFLSLFISTVAPAGAAAQQQEVVVDLGTHQAPYEQRLDFVQEVKNILSGFNERIDDLEGLKADPYTTTYTTLKQKRDAIEYQLEYVDTVDREQWDATRDEIQGRLNELATDLHNLPNVSQVYRVLQPVVLT